MGVRLRWLTWSLVGGLVAAFIGERVFAGLDEVRFLLLVAGAGAVLAATLRRIQLWRGSEGDAARIERVFAFGYMGCVIAMVGFMVGTEDGVAWLGLDFAEPLEELRFRRAFLIGSTILLSISLLPTLIAQWATRYSLGTPGTTLRITTLRVLDTATSALSVALAGAFVAMGGYVTAANDKTFDASYFKTSTPGTAVQEIVLGMDSPLRVLLFFPEVDPVKDEVQGYFRELANTTGRVTIEEYDRLAQPLAAAEYNVEVDATVVFALGERREHILLPTNLAAARSTLRVLDGQVQARLLKLDRDRYYAYVSVGHGELNDPFRDGGGGQDRLGGLKQMLQLLSYEVRELGLRTGLGTEIPSDAAALLVVGPQRPFIEEEVAAVRSYLEGGGSVLFAVDPESDFSLEPFRDLLGVEYRYVGLADEQQHVRQRGGLADRRLIITNRFTAHAAVTTAGRRGVGAGVLFPGAGHLVAAEDVEGPRPRFVAEAMPTTFEDVDGDLQYDGDDEQRGGLQLAAAVEGSELEDGMTMRALVYADADMFSDAVLLSLQMNAAIVADGIRWLGREETFAGDVVSEEDVPIVHTRAENVAWFYAIILGAPTLVLLMGLGVYLRPRLGRVEEAA
jgi:hypothetical protein